MIIAHTIKGKGNRETENLVDSHHVKVPDQATYDKFMCGLECKCDLPYAIGLDAHAAASQITSKR